MLSLFAFHFALRRSLATAQSKPFGRPLLAAFVPIQHGSPPTSENARTPCKTTKCLRHISLGLNFGGVRRHFGLPLQSSNLIGDFRSVASIPQSLLPLPTPH